MSNLNLRWTSAFLDELVRSGVRHACISPGSRSTPLTLAAAGTRCLTTSVHLDERSAAFFALGYARATGRPAALVCTSGTAAANYLPAVIEAHYSHVPMLLLTADRPPELRDTGAWQAIDQLKLYGGYVRWFAEMSTPADEARLWRTLRSLASRAVAVAVGRPAGPVHLNFPFREPLAPSGQDAQDEATSRQIAHPDSADSTASDPGLTGRPDQLPFLRSDAGSLVAPPQVVGALVERIAAEPRGLILCGQMDAEPAYPAAIAHLARTSGYPVLAEPASGLRYGSHDRTSLVTGYDALLRDDTWSTVHAPGLVLRFGASLTWKVVADFLERHPTATQVIVDPQGAWDDPTRLAGWRIVADPTGFAQAVAAALESAESGAAHSVTNASAADDSVAAEATGSIPARERDPRTAWRGVWMAASETAAAVLGETLREAAEETVPWIYAVLAECLPARAVVYAANSMAVRDLDTFLPAMSTPLSVIANRGAAGIDGTVSSALGAAFGTDRPTLLVTGDLAFLHDLNGLAAGKMAGLNATIVVLNDNGGGIFEYLPIASQDRATFDRFFRTPAGADLAAACAVYGIEHVRAEGRSDFAAALTERLTRPGTQVVEVPIDTVANTAVHRGYWAEVKRRLHAH